MAFVVGEVLPSQSIASTSTATFNIPQNQGANGPTNQANARNRCLVIVCPAAFYWTNTFGDATALHYAFDGVAGAASPTYDASVGLPIAIPPNARTLSVYNNIASSTLVATVALGHVR
jgi:hypothetical protein